MAVLEKAKSFLLPEAQQVPPRVKQRLNRGRAEMLRDANKRRLCMRFERGETWWFINEKNVLIQQDTVTFAGGKPPYRMRNTHNFIRPIVEGKTSWATQRIPGYEVLPTATDPDKVAAAKLAEQVLMYGYDKWRLRQVSIDMVKLAISGGGEAFAMPYFDPNVGPYHFVKDPQGKATDPQTGESGKWVGEGEIKIRVFNGNEVYWEPGVNFDDSRWWATEQAVPVDVVKEYEGYIGGDLAPDAASSDIPRDSKPHGNLVMVVEYYERPCPEYPRGRKIRLASGRIITPPEDYPLLDSKNQVLDEPVIHRLVYTHDPDGKRDLGLVWQLIDPQRTAQDCWNKLLEWKNRCLNPQMMAPIGANLKRPDDTPGRINYYRPVSGQVPQWEKPPQIPAELFQMIDRARAEMRDISSDEQIEAAPNLAAATIQQVLEVSRARWGSFLGDFADWHSHLARHCLFLVQRHYTEERDLQIRGAYSPYPIKAFLGEQILDQQDVRVQPQSLQVRTRDQLHKDVMEFAQLGWIAPEQAMAAISGGVGVEKLVESYELDIARVNRIIQKIRDGSVMDMKTRPGTPDTAPMNPDGSPVLGPDGNPEPAPDVPGWMPDEQDKLPVWKWVLSDWMKTDEFDQLDPQYQEVAHLMFQGIQDLEAKAAQRAQMLQAAQAEQLGMNNAAKPQSKGMPSLPGGGPAGPQPPPQNQPQGAGAQ